MSLTNVQLRAQIDSTIDEVILPSEMVAILDRAIAETILVGGLVVSYSIGGRSKNISLGDAIRLREMYHKLSVIDGASSVTTYSEFSEG